MNDNFFSSVTEHIKKVRNKRLCNKKHRFFFKYIHIHIYNYFLGRYWVRISSGYIYSSTYI
jgi:hypothetical protein